MADPKKDVSTDIEKKVGAFLKIINADLAAMRKASQEKQKKEGDKGQKPASSSKKLKPGEGDLPEVIFSLSKSKVSETRTPAEQAEQVAKGKSWVCWSSHMSDKARHVLMKVDGKVAWDPKKALGENFEAFKKKWAAAMKKQGLKNYKGQDGYGEGDAFHLELPDAKLDKSDKRVAACLEEYVKLSRQKGGKKNDKFEKSYEKLLKPYITKYEKDAAKKGGK